MKSNTILMKTVKVTRHTRELIRTYSVDGESVSDTVDRLLKSNNPLPKEDRTVTNISLNEDTFNNLKKYKSYDTESHSDVIMRLILQSLD